MDQNKMERCMMETILNLIYHDEGVIVELDGDKYIISTENSGLSDKDDMIKIEKITGDDDCIVQSLSEGQKVYLDK